jgi:hypothetical protein
VFGMSVSVAFHWYSARDPTVMLVLAADFELTVHDPPWTVPHFTLAVELDRSVAQLIVAELPTTSVR